MDNAFGQPQTVVVLGGTSDLARAVVRRLASARADTVVLAGRDPEALARAAEEARDFGATATPLVTFDATDVADAGRAVADCFAAAGGEVDLVIVAVGRLGHQGADEDDPVAAGEGALVNFAWPVAALAGVRARLVAQGHGRILVMSSVAAIRVRPSAYLYGGAKAGLDRLCGGLADSLAGTGVSLVLLRPGFVRTKMTAGEPEPPLTTGVEPVAEAVVRGLATGQSVIWSPPILRPAMLVLRHLPAGLWRRVMDR